MFAVTHIEQRLPSFTDSSLYREHGHEILEHKSANRRVGASVETDRREKERYSALNESIVVD